MSNVKTFVPYVACSAIVRSAMAVIAAGLFTSSALAQSGTERELVIDDFTSGEVSISLSGVSTGKTVRSQPGTMLGGWRQIGYKIRAQPDMFDTPSGYVEVIPDLGKVVANHDYNTAHKLSYGYGYGEPASGAGMSVDLSAFDRFEVEFEGADVNVTVHIMACSNSCAKRATLGRNIVQDRRISAIYTGTTQVLPFDEFNLLPGFDWADVTHIQMFTQSSNTAMSADFAIDRFIAAAM